MSADPGITFPGESSEYRLARNRLLAAETELRRMIERVAAQRRALPPGGAVPGDYVFEAASGGGEERFSELFGPGKDTLVVYSLLRTLEDGFGLGQYLGNDNAVTPITSIWRVPAS